MSKIIVGTIVAENYLPAARVLADSFRRHHPKIPLRVLLVGSRAGHQAAKKTGLKVLHASDLGLPEIPLLFPGYDRQQVVVALKPFLLEHLLKSTRRTVVFLDADILVTASLDPLFAEVAQHSMTVTPHIGLSGPKSGRSQIEHTILLSGMYNGGFVGVTRREETLRFLAWWKQRLTTHCKCAPPEGFLYDQRWLDLAPGFVTDFHVFRDPGCNVAYWNLPELEMTRRNDAFQVNRVPLRFFHFSGFDVAKPEDVSRHAPNSKVSELGMLTELFHHYRALLEKAGWADAVNAPWTWEPPEPGWWQRLRASLARWLSQSPLMSRWFSSRT